MQVLLHSTTILSVSKGLKAVPLLGAYRGSDFLDEMRGGPGSLLDHLIRFAAKLDPNGDPAGIFWPQYAVESKDILMIGEWPWSPPTIAGYVQKGGDKVPDEL